MNKALAISTLLSLAIVSLSGCFGSSSSSPAPTSPTGSASMPACTFTQASTTQCILYIASIGQTAITTACASVSGTTSAACATSAVLGVCTIASSTTTVSVTYYTGGLLTDSEANTACTTASPNGLGGTYTSG